MNKIWSVHIMEYYSVTKKERSTDTGYSMENLENVIVNNRSRQKKPHILSFYFYETPCIGESIPMGNRLVIVEAGWGKGNEKRKMQRFVCKVV
jgi:hypothetical protein